MKKLSLYNLQNIMTLIALVMIGCADNKTQETPPGKEDGHGNDISLTALQYKATGIELGAIEERQLTGLLKVNGLLDVPPQNQVSISVPFGGTLRETNLLQGMWVKKGAVIARMEHPDYIQMQQDYLEAQNQFDFMEKEYQRQSELNTENVTAAKTFQRTESDYKTLKSKVDALRQKLALLNVDAKALVSNGIIGSIPVVSPIDGYVTEVNANIGKFVQANEVIFEIVDTRHLHVELSVFEKDIPRVKKGQKVLYTLANDNREHLAEVNLIGREIASDRTVRIHCHMLKEDTDLLPGMFLKATIETGASDTDALPAAAVVSSEGKYFIFVEEVSEQHAGNHKDNNHHFRMIEISTGVTDNGFTEVILPDNFDKSSRQIVLQGAYDLLSKRNNSEEHEH